MPYSIRVDWDDVPHLTAKAKAELLESYSPHERDARSKGVPIMGSGLIYPLPEDTFVCDPFEIPTFWPRAYGFDVGWNKTAAIWGAWDRESDIVYCYSEYYQGKAEPSIHADSIKARGDWIIGAIDPASAGSSQIDGRKVIDEYRLCGLELTPAANAVESGIHAIYRRLSAGRLKIFNTLNATRAEIRMYRRDEQGKVVKANDHLMDALKYLIMTGLISARTEPVDFINDYENMDKDRSSVTGY